MDYQSRLLKAIPGGAHTYSRGQDQFPSNAPALLKNGKGAYVYDQSGNKYLDYGMGLRSVVLGYAEDEVDLAAFQQIKNGNNLTRPSFVELEAAELFIDLIDSVDMVKFTKNGSTAVSAAVKLARAYTGREMVVRCAEQPFFSFDDWFIGSTEIKLGVTKDAIEKTKTFKFNDSSSFEELLNEYPNQIACIVMEPATTVEPLPGFFKKVEDLCKKNGVIFILDEMITGFRWHLKGAQFLYGINPDLCTFGKAMANGFSLAAIGGRREIMELGSIETIGKERVFLLSTTHGAEMGPLGAFISTVNFMKRNDVINHLWNYGSSLKAMLNHKAKLFGIDKSFKAFGIDCSPSYSILDQDGNNCLGLRTLFIQEMVKSNILLPWIALTFSHGKKELQTTEIAIDKAFATYRLALESSYENYLDGPVIKPVFRRFN
ncbi:glutamate-1-semialdehyde 2,1-aminomutase [Polynucleobacter sp. JS-JIR-5-A7]|nr:glutamate-1-semialdehyde 2,1-aminomutase [Polynucleobacter sp. JS-JIR-5-A7]